MEEQNDKRTIIQLPWVAELLRIVSIPDLDQIDPRAIKWTGISLGEGKTNIVEQNQLETSRGSPDFTWVAIKCVKSTIPKALEENLPTSAENMYNLKEVRQELDILLHPPLRHHPNIIRLLGYTWKEVQAGCAPMLVMEVASLGSLNMLLLRTHLNEFDLNSLCADVACGLAVIHASGITHGDLKLENVLVFENPSGRPAAKLSDFGQALLDYQEVPHRGTPLYNAPEIQAQHGGSTSVSSPLYLGSHHSGMADVFSYGLLTFEIFNRGKRYYDCPETEPFRQALLKDPLGMQPFAFVSPR